MDILPYAESTLKVLNGRLRRIPLERVDGIESQTVDCRTSGSVAVE
jgi:hypothetical protein